MKLFKYIQITITIVISLSISLYAKSYRASTSDYLTFVSSLQPGDSLILKDGNYLNGFRISNVNGTAQNWISICAEHKHQAVLMGRNGSNTMDINNCSYLEIAGFKFDGKHIPGIDAIGCHGPSTDYNHHIRLDGNYITGHDGDRTDQQTVGISTKITCWDWTISNNEIIEAGTGIYLGNSDGSAPFIRGIIEFNLIEHPLGYCMEVKMQNNRPNLPGIPTENCRTTIRHNVFAKDTTASPDGDRPNLLVDGQPLSGNGKDDRVEIYGNLLYDNPREYLFQGTGNVSFHNNILVSSPVGAMHFMSHNNRQPKELFIYQNSLYVEGDPLTISSPDLSYNQTIEGNAIFSNSTVPTNYKTGNITGNFAEADNYYSNPSLNIDSVDFYPLNSVAQANTDLSQFSKDPAVQLDFNALSQDGKVYGAYGGKGKNPGWKPALEIKTSFIQTSVPENNLSENNFQLNVFPNPISMNTNISFCLHKYSKIKINIFNSQGILIKQIVDNYLSSGYYSFQWEGTDDKGTSVNSGVYFYQLNTGKEIITKKLVFIK